MDHFAAAFRQGNLADMCLIAFDFRPDAACRLRLMANRDELHARPAAPLDRWQDAPAIIGGRDLQGGGGWLAMHASGRFAAVTNVRDPLIDAGDTPPSRGQLVRNALECDDLESWLEELASGAAWSYAGVNLLAGDGKHLWHLHRGRQALTLTAVPPGIHGLSNATLNTPWPKLQAARAGMSSREEGQWPERALARFSDSREADDAALPDTGVGLELERRLSAAFIVGRDYGTRATTWLEWHADGQADLHERRFGPEGVLLGERAFQIGPFPPER